jgi:hypothetical protein
MNRLILLVLILALSGCAIPNTRYESTSAWIDPARGLVLIEVAHPEVFTGCDTMSGDRQCRETRGYSDYRTVVVDIEEGRISGQGITVGPTAPVLQGYPLLAPREFTGRVNVVEVIAEESVSYIPYAPLSGGGWVYYAPGRKRVATVTDSVRFAAADFNQLIALGGDSAFVRVVDISEGKIRVAKQPRGLPDSVFSFQPLKLQTPPEDLELLSVSPSGELIAYSAIDPPRIIVVNDSGELKNEVFFPAPVDFAFIDEDLLLTVERNSDEPRVDLVTVKGEHSALPSTQIDLKKRVLMVGTSIVAFEQPDGIVFVSELGGMAEFPTPVGPVSIDGSLIYLMYDDLVAGERVLIEFDMESGEEQEVGRFEGYATLLGRVNDTLVVYSPNPLLPGSVLYLIDSEITEMHISTRLMGLPTTVFGPISEAAK